MDNASHNRIRRSIVTLAITAAVAQGVNNFANTLTMPRARAAEPNCTKVDYVHHFGGDTLWYCEDGGFKVLDKTGNVKTSFTKAQVDDALEASKGTSSYIGIDGEGTYGTVQLFVIVLADGKVQFSFGGWDEHGKYQLVQYAPSEEGKSPTQILTNQDSGKKLQDATTGTTMTTGTTFTTPTFTTFTTFTTPTFTTFTTFTTPVYSPY